jgi:hypothetical protein
MSEKLTLLLDDLQRLAQQLDARRTETEEGKGPAGTHEPERPLASSSGIAAEEKIGEANDLIIKADGKVPGLIIGVGVDKDSAVKLERIEVTPEADGRVRIMVSAKKE